MSNVSPRLHRLNFGEGLNWRVPAGVARFYAWRKSAPDGLAPVWAQAAGWNALSGERLSIDHHVGAGGLVLNAAGVMAGWAALLGLFDGHDPEVAMVTGEDQMLRVVSIDRYALPAPNSTDAATIAAQERKLLQTLLTTRESVAGEGMVKITDPSGTATEQMELPALDRRIAEVRARIRWFELAADGNHFPRAELW